MSRGFPSMTALLGLLAIAGYQNRDKIAEMLGGLNKPGSSGQGGIGGLLGQLSSSLGGASTGGILSAGLGEILERFKQSGQGDTAESWVKNRPKQTMHCCSARKSNWPRSVRNFDQTDRVFAGRTGLASVSRTSRRRR